MKSHFFTNAAQLLSFGIFVCAFTMVYLYALLGTLETDQAVVRVGVLCGVVCSLFLCVGLSVIRKLATPSIKNTLGRGDVLIASGISGALCFGVFFSLMSMALGLVILNPALGWLSTIQEGVVLMAAFAGLACYVSILAGIGLVFPFLFSLHSENISSYEWE